MIGNLLFITMLFRELLGWSSLADVTFKLQYVEEFDEKVEVPVFGQKLKALEGKEFTVSGYYVPAEIRGAKNTILLSKMPYASCFFCGGAGIESVIEIEFDSKPRRFVVDEIVTISGTLELNALDFDHLIFIVRHAKEVES